MFSNQIKKWFREKLNLKVRVRSTNGKHPYFGAWIPSEPREKFSDPLVYKQHFPEDLGDLCLQVIYDGQISGPWAGNVERHSIAMHEEQWQKVMAEYKKEVAA